METAASKAENRNPPVTLKQLGEHFRALLRREGTTTEPVMIDDSVDAWYYNLSTSGEIVGFLRRAKTGKVAMLSRLTRETHRLSRADLEGACGFEGLAPIARKPFARKPYARKPLA